MRILLIDNDPVFCDKIAKMLQNHHLDLAQSIKDGAYFITIRNYNLVILNYFFPEEETLEMLARIKASSNKTSILVVSSKYHKEFELKSFYKGADDFLLKSSDEDVLLARINAKLRLHHSQSLHIKDLQIFPENHQIFFQQEEIHLKGKPFEVLWYLALHSHQIISKEELLHSLWEDPEFVTPNVLEVVINQIRQKLDKAFGITTIETIRKKGYRFCYPHQSSS